MITLEYSSNNSGGRWWLTDQHWKDLEAAGWEVQWFKNEPPGLLRDADTERWLGALASRASKACETPDDAVAEWTSITGLDPWDEGYNCCGAPHSFSYTDASGTTRYAETIREVTFAGWR